MTSLRIALTLAAALALAAAPAGAASERAKQDAQAFGKYCKGQSKKKAKGKKGTDFSRCVTAMARLSAGSTDSPAAACKNSSMKPKKGRKGTPFSRCVIAGEKLLREQAALDEQLDAEDDLPDPEMDLPDLPELPDVDGADELEAQIPEDPLV